MIWPEKERQRKRRKQEKGRGWGWGEIEGEKRREGGGSVRETEEIIVPGRSPVPGSQLSRGPRLCLSSVM